MKNFVDILDKCKTEQDCLTLAKNARAKNRQDIVDAANLKAALIRQEAYKKTGRRPDIDYHACGLKDGELIYLPDLNIEAEVFTHRTLFFEGTEIYITPLEKKLIDKGYPRKQIVNKWRNKQTNELVNDAYNKVYPKL